ncbi:leucine-rich repeat domain-containing protein [Fulvivirga maritima]|uniref:leucine-rich repeat domain-containing protein n=1 Tax=Fulvivirga maritima TaxID=2904247 RepID=UPI001F360469|nr:leucine-rich repeat domain-containing protein [Fulvivirga maritima]UII29153.1 leucine-rich repeat domain-containing protein [Fulvivirga maritima]
MKINKLTYLILILFLSGLSHVSFSQQQIEDEQMDQYEEKVKEIVNFLEYVLNTLGDKSTSARDKDVIINQSYTKIFRDAEVQVEDDLDEARDVITNKDVQAYLKDIDFFFKEVKFDFNIEDISHYVNDNGELFFKVSMTRNLSGVSLEGDSVNNTKKRFIEVNLDQEAQDLKIVSLYTNPLNQKEALAKWWNALSYEWKAIFKRKAGVTQTATDSDIKHITELDELDISGNNYITNIEPLSVLSNLKILDISNSNIEDLKPIRNLTNLEELNVSHTKITSLEALKYASSLKYLQAQHTPLNDISVLSRLSKLQTVNLTDTQVQDFTALSGAKQLNTLNLSKTNLYSLIPIGNITALKELNITGTQIDNLGPLSSLSQLEILKADSTPIYSLAPLKSMAQLKILSINYTTIDDLSPLSSISTLEKVYCDSTNISKDDANEFMTSNTGMLVIFESDDLKNWWSQLSIAWQDIIKKFVPIAGKTPSKEELAKITALDSINFDNNLYIENLEPLSKLRKLKKLIASNTAIADLSPISGFRNLNYLDISDTKVEDFGTLAQFQQLEVLKANRTGLASLDTLMQLNRLRLIEADFTMIKEQHVDTFLKQHPDALIIFKSEYLTAWWGDLSSDWRNIFSIQTSLSSEPTKYQLHKLIELTSIVFSEANVMSLQPLENFVRLKEVKFSGTGISDLSTLTKFKGLEKLQASKSPVSDLKPLSELSNLKYLDISNTPVDDLKPLSDLYSLEEINCAGTQIKRLRELDNLANLKVLDCSNTNIKKLDEVAHLNLKVLKCYNTRTSDGRVEDFKESNPECNVIYY